MYELLLIICLAALGLLSHLAAQNRFVKWLLRSIIFCTGLYEAGIGFALVKSSSEGYLAIICAITAFITILILFKPFRKYTSWLITGLQIIITGNWLMPFIRKDLEPFEYFRKKRIFAPNSFPHLIALFIYVTSIAYVLTSTSLKDINLSLMPLPNPFAVQHILACAGLVFLLFAFCGVGIYITRSRSEVFKRLLLVSPSRLQISAALIFILLSFVYDAFWLIYSHSGGLEPDLPTRLSYYNSATFTIAGSFVPSVILALLTTTCAAIGEEVLIRGALQPVFGILPSALLHGLLHSQLNPTPIFILQVALWSTFMGMMRRYTNTTTTIIAHAGLNILTVALYAANP